MPVEEENLHVKLLQSESESESARAARDLRSDVSGLSFSSGSSDSASGFTDGRDYTTGTTGVQSVPVGGAYFVDSINYLSELYYYNYYYYYYYYGYGLRTVAGPRGQRYYFAISRASHYDNNMYRSVVLCPSPSSYKLAVTFATNVVTEFGFDFLNFTETATGASAGAFSGRIPAVCECF